ncbi:MAG: DEAD/DEAH box helicase [Pseudomonadota bacterium]
MTTDFPAFGLADPLLRVLGQEGYEIPTPIQQEIIPALMDGRDVLGIAQTGTGKTAAFVLPLLHHLYKERKKPKPKTATVLMLAPTRELARQVAGNVETYGREMRLRTALVVGGVRYGPQTKKLSDGVDLLIATPGRLEDLMGMEAVSLTGTRYLVLDEADQMLDLGFAPVIARLAEAIPQPRQTALLSATMEKKVRQLALKFLDNPVEVSIGAAAKPVDRIAQSVVHVAPTNKRQALLSLLAREQTDRVIIFARTKFGAEKLALFLSKNDVKAGAIHGNKNQRQRERALDRFRDGKTPVLVATDVAARGIDVPAVSHVINFELPEVPEAYVHRIGRTGRAGQSGIAISLCGAGERVLLRDIEKLTGKPVPVETIEGIEPLDPGTDEPGDRPKRGRRPTRKSGPRGPRKPDRKPRQKRATDNADNAVSRDPATRAPTTRAQAGASDEARKPRKASQPNRPGKPTKSGKPSNAGSPGKFSKSGKPASKTAKPARDRSDAPQEAHKKSTDPASKKGPPKRKSGFKPGGAKSGGFKKGGPKGKGPKPGGAKGRGPKGKGANKPGSKKPGSGASAPGGRAQKRHRGPKN